MHFKIKVPIWKTRSVGLDQDKIVPGATVEITYLDKSGKRLYPWIYEVPDVVENYPTQNVKGHTLKLIPIFDLQPLQRIHEHNTNP